MGLIRRLWVRILRRITGRYIVSPEKIAWVEHELDEIGQPCEEHKGCTTKAYNPGGIIAGPAYGSVVSYWMEEAPRFEQQRPTS